MPVGWLNGWLKWADIFNLYGHSPTGSGFLDTDFVLYVSTELSDRCKQPNTVAYAAYCQLEAETDRPLAGYVNICPSKDNLSAAAHHYSSLLSTVSMVGIKATLALTAPPVSKLETTFENVLLSIGTVNFILE